MDLMEGVWIFLTDNESLLIWLGLFSVITLVASIIVIPFIISCLPEDYFIHSEVRSPLWKTKHPVIRWTLILIKNVIGVVLLVLGVAMLILPGQGLLTLFIALLFLDFPGKYKLEKRVVQNRVLQQGVNWIRQKASKAPLKFEP